MDFFVDIFHQGLHALPVWNTRKCIGDTFCFKHNFSKTRVIIINWTEIILAHPVKAHLTDMTNCIQLSFWRMKTTAGTTVPAPQFVTKCAIFTHIYLTYHILYIPYLLAWMLFKFLVVQMWGSIEGGAL